MCSDVGLVRNCLSGCARTRTRGRAGLVQDAKCVCSASICRKLCVVCELASENAKDWTGISTVYTRTVRVHNAHSRLPPRDEFRRRPILVARKQGRKNVALALSFPAVFVRGVQKTSSTVKRARQQVVPGEVKENGAPIPKTPSSSTTRQRAMLRMSRPSRRSRMERRRRGRTVLKTQVTTTEQWSPSACV